MNYKLAKQLKDAGFPQSTLGQKGNVLTNPDKDANDWVAYAPTLSELIKECGVTIELVISPNGLTTATRNHGVEKPPDITMGDTPEEAVAKLYLELSK